MVCDARGQAAADGGLHQEDVHRSDQGRTDMTFRVFHELEKLVQRRASGLRLGWVRESPSGPNNCSQHGLNFCSQKWLVRGLVKFVPAVA